MATFISYRRGDSPATAGRLDDHLRETLGSNEVYRDIENIPLGADFVEHLRTALDNCDVGVVVIGPNWDPTRLSQPQDFVRMELDTLIARNIPIIPVLVEHATLPLAEALPETVRPLLRRNAIEVNSGADFHDQVRRLVNAIQEVRAHRNTELQRGPAAGPERIGVPILKQGPKRRWSGPLLVGVLGVASVPVVVRLCNREPCAVACVKSARIEKQITNDESVLDAAADAISNGRIKLQAGNKSEAIFRAISDKDIVEVIKVCTSACAAHPASAWERLLGAGNRRTGTHPGVSTVQVDGWVEVHVTEKNSESGLSHEVKNAEATVGTAKSCVTDDRGRCIILLTGVNLVDVLDVTVKGPNGILGTNQSKKVADLIGKELPLGLNPSITLVSVSVTACPPHRLRDARLTIQAIGAEAWGATYGESYPDNIALKSEQQLAQHEASFWVSGNATKFRFVLKSADAAPKTYEVDAGPTGFAFEYPEHCPVRIVAAPTPLERCPRLESWVRQQLAPPIGAPQGTIQVVPTANGLRCEGCSGLTPPSGYLKPNCAPFTVIARRKG